MKLFSLKLETTLLPHEVFAHWSTDKGALFFDSADDKGTSIICLPPDDIFTYKYTPSSDSDPFADLERFWKKHKCEDTEKTHFTGGIAGYISYDIRQSLETFKSTSTDDLNMPDIWMGAYKKVISFDHQKHVFTLHVQASNMEEAQNKALIINKKISKQYVSVINNFSEAKSPYKWRSNFSPTAYQKMLQKVIDYIYEGDIFQACLAQRFQTDLPRFFNPYALYQKLRANSPAPFAGYLNMGGTQLFTNSPERFLECKDGHVETKPIKGTRPRGETEEQDTALAEALLASNKERAENAMIVDILRNDLHKSCDAQSVTVPDLFKLESYANVHHLVSTVKARLKPNKTTFDLLKTCLPGGSISGAPKIRAMEIIEELETVRRGPYCGTLGYIGYNGQMDMNILIRCCLIKDQTASIYSGGGIVANSDPLAEYEETLDKAQSLFEAFR